MDVNKPKAKVRGIANKRIRRRKSRKFKGKKERLREEIEILKTEKKEYAQRNSKLSLQCKQLERNIMQTKLVNMAKRSLTMTSCKTKTTIPTGSCSLVNSKYPLTGVRHFSRPEINVMKSSELGKGRFGKCVLGILGPLKVCIKVCRPDYEDYFNREVRMLLQCCHSNLPMLHGICIDVQKMIIMSLHEYGKDNSLSLHAAVCTKNCKVTLVPDFSVKQWKNILRGLICAVKYLHGKKILHNDIKGDNIVIEKQDTNNVQSVLIDLGKACYIHEAKKYSLTNEEKKKYTSDHPQIAPELRNGYCKQSEASDVYSAGRIIDILNRHKLSIPVLTTISQDCLQQQSTSRPSSSDLYTSLTFLLE